VDTDVPHVENGPRSAKAKTPYCGVCFKAKQPASVYNSHWTRMNPNPRSPITCPLILQTTCNYCKKKGHSAKYCPVAEKKEMRRRLRSSSVSSNVSSQSNVTDVEVGSLEKGGWLQAAMKSVDTQKENEENDHKNNEKNVEKRLRLEDPKKAGLCEDIPSPPKLRRERARWDWNEDVDSEDEQVLWG
jgi:hypothetical protein